MTRKSILILVAVVALVAVGVFTVSAQTNPATPSTPTCPGMGQGRQGMMGGFGMMAGSDDTMMAAVAKVLGLDTTAFIDKLHSGQTLTQIAEAQGVKLQDVYDTIIAQAEAHMALRVKDGMMTQEQADAHIAWMRENIANMPMFGGAGNCAMGNGMGMMGSGSGMMGHHGMGMGGGMMGRGHGMGMRGNNT